MDERHVLSEQEVADLVIGLRSLEWSWDPNEVDQIAEQFAWKIAGRTNWSVMLDTRFGPDTGRIAFDDAGVRVEQLSLAVSQPTSAKSVEGRQRVQDAFAHVVSAATGALGEPTSRLPGDLPEVRWRGDTATVGVKRSSVQVNVFLATNEYIDNFDWAVSRGL
ncbi:MAG: DUF6301 family protein [Actinomadura sp.]